MADDAEPHCEIAIVPELRAENCILRYIILDTIYLRACVSTDWLYGAVKCGNREGQLT